MGKYINPMDWVKDYIFSYFVDMRDQIKENTTGLCLDWFMITLDTSIIMLKRNYRYDARDSIWFHNEIIYNDMVKLFHKLDSDYQIPKQLRQHQPRYWYIRRRDGDYDSFSYYLEDIEPEDLINYEVIEVHKPKGIINGNPTCEHQSKINIQTNSGFKRKHSKINYNKYRYSCTEHSKPEYAFSYDTVKELCRNCKERPKSLRHLPPCLPFFTNLCIYLTNPQTKPNLVSSKEFKIWI